MRKINNEVKYRYLTELTELEGNPRTITREKMQKLVDSIKANPDYLKLVRLSVPIEQASSLF